MGKRERVLRRGIADDVEFGGAFARSMARKRRLALGDSDVASVAGLEPGEVSFILTDSRPSMIDYIERVMRDAGDGAELGVCSWNIYRGDIARLAWHANEGRLGSARFIIDRSTRSRRADGVHAIEQLFGLDAFREIRIHAKAVYVDNGPGLRWGIISSMNLNANMRTESLVAMRDDGVAGMLSEFFDLVFDRVAPGDTSVGDPLPAPEDAAGGVPVYFDPLDAMLADDGPAGDDSDPMDAMLADLLGGE